MSALALEQPPSEMQAPPSAQARIDRAIDAACKRIAPLWPLKHFVAVNPFLGFSQRHFSNTCAHLQRVTQTAMLMPRSFYAAALANQIIDGEALAEALRLHPLPGMTVEKLRAAASSLPENVQKTRAVVATVAEVLDTLTEGDRHISRVQFMIDEISAFCAAYFDEGQSSWRLPWRDRRPYAAWRQQMAYDRNPEAMGISGFRATVLALPDNARAAITAVVAGLGIPDRAVEDYIYRPLFDIGGWAAYVRYRGWQAELDEQADDTLVELLAIRMAWGWGLFNSRRDEAFRTAWANAMLEASHLPAEQAVEASPDLAVDLALQEAYELAFRKRFIARLTHRNCDPGEQPSARPALQAAFCIDVRSEIFRRALEAAYPAAQTIGFAGFFGFPIEYVPIGQTHGRAQCPVLLKPSFIVCEAVKGADENEETEVLGLRLLRRRAEKAWKSFKLSAVSSFSFVETVGIGFAAKLATDSMALTRPVPSADVDGLDDDIVRRVAPRLAPRELSGRQTGFAQAQKVAMAEAVLKAMSLKGPFARLVLLAGHGSTTVNNPHASSLDCGACGGHTGEANARVAAAILNDTLVRRELVGKGIAIPDDCWFVAALHNTTTDEVKLFDEEFIPGALAADLARLKEALTKAAAFARLERSAALGIEDRRAADSLVKARSRDWSQVRPEWGLAGNAAFIAAPRTLTRGVDFEGRVFLHSYEHAQDEGYKVLELIMTAPMVVANWINLQYYGSTVNNAVFGSGNKVLHNVTGQLGVLEGNAGDLRVGLPWQSVHDGRRFVHEPLRLNVFIAAPESAMDEVMARHQGVRDLVVNEWLFLHSLSDDGRTVRRCGGPSEWRSS